jgi:hypothetical protein
VKFSREHAADALEFIESRLAHLNTKETADFWRSGDFVEGHVAATGGSFDECADAFRVAAYDFVRNEIELLILDAKKVPA